MSKRMIEIDEFAIAMKEIVKEVETPFEKGITRAVNKACKDGKRAIMQSPGLAGVKGTGKYKAGFGYTTKRKRTSALGEIGNKEAGLVHLLEKGHAKMGGGRTRAFPHMIDGKKAADETLWQEIEKLGDEAVG